MQRFGVRGFQRQDHSAKTIGERNLQRFLSLRHPVRAAMNARLCARRCAHEVSPGFLILRAFLCKQLNPRRRCYEFLVVAQPHWWKPRRQRQVIAALDGFRAQRLVGLAGTRLRARVLRSCLHTSRKNDRADQNSRKEDTHRRRFEHNHSLLASLANPWQLGAAAAASAPAGLVSIVVAAKLSKAYNHRSEEFPLDHARSFLPHSGLTS